MHLHIHLSGVALVGLVLAACVVVPPANLPASSVLPAPPPALTPDAQEAQPTATMPGERAWETTQVTLDIFSGRPNPAWTLAAGQAQSLRALLEQLPEVACRPMNLGLGYRGFVVLLGQRPELSNEYRVRVRSGQIRWGDPWDPEATAVCRSDAARQVERFLLASGQAALTKDLFALVASQIEQPPTSELAAFHLVVSADPALGAASLAIQLRGSLVEGQQNESGAGQALDTRFRTRYTMTTVMTIGL